MSSGSTAKPGSAIVVGAGIVGLSTAWFLQERGVEVTVVDRAGASRGNGGWITPRLTLPLDSPDVLRHGLRALRDASARLHFPLATNGAAGLCNPGRLLAEQITTGKQPQVLAEFDPLRPSGRWRFGHPRA